jgi:glutathione synthase/RimK-type ligase-like ATP-grasp enzyme
MKHVVVTDEVSFWSEALADVEIVGARDYIVSPSRWPSRGVKVFNLCRSYRYQSIGYYVSLLASARGHRPIPSVATIQDLKATEIVRIRSGDLDDEIQRSLKTIKADKFVLSIYFGRNVAKRHDRLAGRLHGVLSAPLLRARFGRRKDGAWELTGIRPIGSEDIPESHRELALEAAQAYFSRQWRSRGTKRRAPYDLAILVDPSEEEPPSDERAIGRFVKAAKKVGMRPWIISKEDYAEIAEFDALLIRATTQVHHYTYRFARRAAAEGVVVIDDPASIVRCTNKVFLAELLSRHDVPAPKTMIVHRQNLDRVADELGWPVVLKLPDSSFSMGVVKANDVAELEDRANRMLASSELIVAQAFTPTEFDWRVGLFDGEPLWVCRYHMARHHWQIVRGEGTSRRWGKTESIPVADAPRSVVGAAKRAAKLVGRGLYGVDLKQIGRRVFVIEINDNPSIEAGYEDAILGKQLYRRILEGMLERVQKLRGPS